MHFSYNIIVDLKIIGKKIKSTRFQLGYTQEQLAEKVDCSWRYIQAIEQGKRIPSLKWLNSFSEKLEVPLNLFLEH